MERAVVLLQQSRFDLAERELRAELGRNPSNPIAHAFLGLCLAQLGRYPEATKEVDEAVRLAPDLPLAHYARAVVLNQRGRLDEALAAINEAIRLDPEDPEYFAVLGSVHLGRRRWYEALRAAEQGLALDPEQVQCTNVRAMALVQLGRKHEAGTTIASALAKDPENALTHANQGWALLHQSQFDQAAVHFREALRLNPQLAWAREGIVEALKAKNPVYGVLLRYFLWMSRLSRRAQWGFILGAYFGYRLLRQLANSVPALQPLVTPVLVLYGVFAFLTWIVDPLFNLLLRLDRFGRYALTPEQVVASNWVGGTLGVALLAALGWLGTGHPALLVAALLFVALTLPIAGTFQCAPGWPRSAMAAYTVVLAAVGLVGIALSLGTPFQSGQGPLDGPGAALFALVLVGVLLSSLVANGLAMVKAKR